MLMPSEMESFGLAALEAMACSVPAIATRVGGVPELIDDGDNGLLFDVGDIDAMATAAIALLSDPPRLEAMSQAARKHRAGPLLRLPHHPALRGLLRPRRHPHPTDTSNVSYRLLESHPWHRERLRQSFSDRHDRVIARTASCTR